ncbi:MAG: hypothetical protein ACLUVC_02150 [Longibaculum sp.]
MVLSNKLMPIVKRLTEKYSFNEVDSIEIVEFSVEEYKRLKNDYETSSDDYSDDVLIWIKKASFEIAEKNASGIVAGVKSYSENGYSYSTDGGFLSDSLVKEIIPNVDYPK